MTNKKFVPPEDVLIRTYGINQAARVLGVSPLTIRSAIKRGELPAFIPGGRDPLRAGRLGYRIKPADLEAWFFGRSRTQEAAG